MPKKKPVKKVYVIVHDGSKVLVGIGGQCGKVPQPRQGYHLPGGTRGTDASRVGGIIKNPPLEHYQNTALRELEEETGIVLPATTVFTQPKSAKGLEVVAFLVTKVASVDNLVAAFQRPVATDIHDEPFTSIRGVPIMAAIIDNANFNDQFGTSWFLSGINAAYLQNLLV